MRQEQLEQINAVWNATDPASFNAALGYFHELVQGEIRFQAARAERHESSPFSQQDWAYFLSLVRLGLGVIHFVVGIYSLLRIVLIGTPAVMARIDASRAPLEQALRELETIVSTGETFGANLLAQIGPFIQGIPGRFERIRAATARGNVFTATMELCELVFVIVQLVDAALLAVSGARALAAGASRLARGPTAAAGGARAAGVGVAAAQEGGAAAGGAGARSVERGPLAGSRGTSGRGTTAERSPGRPHEPEPSTALTPEQSAALPGRPPLAVVEAGARGAIRLNLLRFFQQAREGALAARVTFSSETFLSATWRFTIEDLKTLGTGTTAAVRAQVRQLVEEFYEAHPNLRRRSYDGGHARASREGGAGGMSRVSGSQEWIMANIFPMLRGLNRGVFRVFEDAVSRLARSTELVAEVRALSEDAATVMQALQQEGLPALARFRIAPGTRNAVPKSFVYTLRGGSSTLVRAVFDNLENVDNFLVGRASDGGVHLTMIPSAPARRPRLVHLDR
jgi:hypothetical protein